MKMSMRYLGVTSVVLAALLNVGCSGGGDTPPAKATGTRKEGTNAFVYLSGDGATPGMPAPAAYANAGCATCHGDNAEGKMGLATEIRHTPVTYSDWVVRHGRVDPTTGMPTSMVAFADAPTMALTAISAADLMTVQTWLTGLPHPTTPANLYNDFCANCHGVDRTGGFTNVSIAAETAAKVSMMVRTGFGTDPSQRDAYMPAFGVGDLSDVELQTIIAYIGAK
jgi:mono/diheme cytochrome c family protein